jgi:ATP-dependent Clp protease adapter protein ClpS
MTGTTATATGITMAGPAVLDRPAQKEIVKERVETEKKQHQSSQQQQRRRQGDHQGHEAWEVRIYNDGLNTREHVARSLVQITGMAEMMAYQTMMTAHQNGMAVVGRYMYEIAEAYHEGLQKDGIICDLVPVEGD